MERTTLNILVKGLHSNKGYAAAALFDMPDGFPGNLEKAHFLVMGPVQDQRSWLEITDLRPGRYAIVTWHDENANTHLDINYKHLPEEGFALSTNGNELLHLRFEKAAIDIAPGEQSLVFTVRYGRS